MSVTILQLDTAFPRIAGDVGCPETYLGDIEVLRIKDAHVGEIVSADPSKIQIAPFEDAIGAARGEVIVTSCGFLSYWQPHLAKLTDKPFISSALTALPGLCETFAPKEILTITFDAASLNASHFGAYETDVVGLHPDMHLRRVISNDLGTLDTELAAREIAELVGSRCTSDHKHILLECTNLPPYKAAISRVTSLPVTDILTCIENVQANTVHPSYLNPTGTLP